MSEIQNEHKLQVCIVYLGICICYSESVSQLQEYLRSPRNAVEKKLRDGKVIESDCPMSLTDYLAAKDSICLANHNNCLKCLVFLKVSAKLLQGGICPLAKLWRYVSSTPYQSDKAKRMLLQMPVAFLSSWSNNGFNQIFVTKKKDEDTYELLLSKLDEANQPRPSTDYTQLMTDMVLIAENEGERERMKYLATSITNASKRKASKCLGVSLGRKRGRAGKVIKNVEETRMMKRHNRELMEVELKAKFGSIRGGVEIIGETVHIDGKDMVVPREELRKIQSKYRMKFKASRKTFLMRRKATKNTRDILSKYPDIGEVMEKYATSCDVGADKWRRTGVLTFGGEKRSEKRLTFEKLRQHLEEVYGRRFSIGTVVELCTPRHKRRRCSLRYKGAAKIKYQRAWKGFNNKLNPDDHWSRAMYRLLDQLQLKNPKAMLLGRDDQAGYRLDTTFTNNQYPSLSVEKTVTTRTDYVNKQSTVLQVTSYNFPATEHIMETCVGVVKGSMVHEKSPSQHMSDLTMLEKKPELSHLFTHKDTEYARVDGASDEGPAHLEVQFLWTERHLDRKRLVTVVSSRCSGDSYLNRVELQNSHLSKGHSNTYIPSTINGANTNSAGKKNSLKQIKQYIFIPLSYGSP